MTTKKNDCDDISLEYFRLRHFCYANFLRASERGKKILSTKLSQYILERVKREQNGNDDDWEEYCAQTAAGWAERLRNYGHDLLLWKSRGNMQKWGVLFYYGGKPDRGGITLEFVFPYFIEVVWIDGPSQPEVGIGHREALERFRGIHPHFEATWRESLSEYGPGLAPALVWASFADTISNLSASGLTREWQSALRCMEKLMREGTCQVSECVAVHLIEALLGRQGEEKIMAPVLRELGPLSRQYALDWNTFSGSSDRGLEY